eukprot:scaffold59583_cov54-Phaeocystis_antarctica.AAC.3
MGPIVRRPLGAHQVDEVEELRLRPEPQAEHEIERHVEVTDRHFASQSHVREHLVQHRLRDVMPTMQTCQRKLHQSAVHREELLPAKVLRDLERRHVAIWKERLCVGGVDGEA